MQTKAKGRVKSSREIFERFKSSGIKKDGKRNTGRMAQGSLELGRALRAIECSRQSSDECQWMVAWEKSMKSVLQEIHDD